MSASPGSCKDEGKWYHPMSYQWYHPHCIHLAVVWIEIIIQKKDCYQNGNNAPQPWSILKPRTWHLNNEYASKFNAIIGHPFAGVLCCTGIMTIVIKSTYVLDVCHKAVLKSLSKPYSIIHRWIQPDKCPFVVRSRCIARWDSQKYGLGKSCRHLRKTKKKMDGVVDVSITIYRDTCSWETQKTPQTSVSLNICSCESEMSCHLPDMMLLTEVDAMFIWHAHTSHMTRIVQEWSKDRQGNFCQCTCTCMPILFL